MSFPLFCKQVNLMKRKMLILYLILILCSILSACTKDTIYGWNPPLKNLQWGMSESEVLSTLNLSEDSVVKESFENYTIISPTKNIEVYGFSVPIEFRIDTMYGLSQVFVDFAKKDMNKVQSSLIKQFGEGEYEYPSSGQQVVWNDKKLGDLESSNQDKILKVYDDVLLDSDPNAPIPFKHVLMEYPFTQCKLVIDEESESFGEFELIGRFPALVNSME